MENIKKNIFLTMLFFGLAAIFNPADASECRNYPKPKVKFSTSYGRLRYDFNHSQEEITALGHEGGHNKEVSSIAGLADIQRWKEIQLGYWFEPIENDQYCVYLKEVNIYVGYKNPIIYVANEYKQGTCHFNRLLRHEQAHQQINKAVLDYFIPVMKRAAQRIANEIPAVKISRTKNRKKLETRRQKAYKQIYNEFKSRFDKIYELFLRERAIEHGKLDNPVNYKAESNFICKN